MGKRSSCCGSAVMNQTSIHEDAGLIRAPLSGLRIWCCHSGGVGHSDSHLALLWLWQRPAATGLTWPLAWKPPRATGMARKRQKQKNKTKHKQRKGKRAVPLWCSRWRIWCCWSCGIGCNWGASSIRGPATSTCHGRGPKKGAKNLNRYFSKEGT